jgi:hypothetical protein
VLISYPGSKPAYDHLAALAVPHCPGIAASLNPREYLEIPIATVSTTATRQDAPVRASDTQQAWDNNTHDKADKGNFVPTFSVIPGHAGRYKQVIPAGRVVELKEQGLSSRDIAKQLELDGLKVSYRTVSRALAGVK